MSVWQLQEAKAKLSQLVNMAEHEPQIISRHGVEKTVVLSLEKYKELQGKKENFVDFMRKSPLYGLDLEFERDKSPAREIEL